MPEDFEVRAASLQDVEWITSLSHQLGYEVTRDEVVERLRFILDADDHILIAAYSAAGEAAGWVHAHIVCFVESERFVEIGGLVVDVQHRRKGAGRALMLAVEDWARQKQVRRIRLRSNVIRKEAHTFYRSLGYCIDKTQFVFSKQV